MLSRVAETLYWSARYIERAENVARLVNVNNLLMMDLPRGVSPGWEPLIDIIGSRDLYAECYNDFSEKNVLKFLTVDPNHPSSILNSLQYARNNIRTVRDVVPREAWEMINGLYQDVKESPNRLLNKKERFAALKQIINASLQVFGALDATMNHDVGYAFLRFGSLLERADMTSRIIDVRSSVIDEENQDIPFENIQWMSVLRSLSGYQMYRQAMGVRVKPRDVLAFTLHDPLFPRSVMFCLYQLKKLTLEIPAGAELLGPIVHAISELEQQTVRELKGSRLHQYIDELQLDLGAIHQQLAEHYFA